MKMADLPGRIYRAGDGEPEKDIGYTGDPMTTAPLMKPGESFVMPHRYGVARKLCDTFRDFHFSQSRVDAYDMRITCFLRDEAH
jgi:hypothetical protein